MSETLKIVDKGTFEKHIKILEYPHPTKERVLFIYSHPGDNIILIHVSRENIDSELFITMYFKDSERPTITSKMEDGIFSYFRDFIGEVDYAYDLKRQVFVFNITTGEEISSPFFLNFDYNIKCKFFLANYMDWTVGKLDRKLVLIKNTEEMLPILIYKSMTNQLIEPTSLEEFGCSLVFELTNSLKLVPHKTDKWFRHAEYAVPFRKKSLLETYLHMDKLVKVIEETEENFRLSKEPKEEKLEGEKSIVRVERELSNISLFNLMSSGKIPFTTKMVPVIIDTFKDELESISSAYILRGVLHLYTNIFEIMKETNSYSAHLKYYKRLIGFDHIIIGYSNDEGIIL